VNLVGVGCRQPVCSCTLRHRSVLLFRSESARPQELSEIGRFSPREALPAVTPKGDFVDAESLACRTPLGMVAMYAINLLAVVFRDVGYVTIP